MKMIQRIWKAMREHIKNSFIFSRFPKRPIRRQVALVESRSGEDFAGNMYYLALELNQRGVKVYVPYKAAAEKKIKAIAKTGNFFDIHFVKMYDLKYYSLLATAQYLFNDVAFDWKWIKREGQIYVNTWHGTPLKTLGYDVKKERYIMGNLQRNLLMADYITIPSEYFKEKISAAYHIDRLFRGRFLLSGYPRNSVLLDASKAGAIKRKYGIDGKQLIVYMPTWRGAHGSSNQKNVLQQYLDEIDSALDDNQIMYLKLHNLDRQRVDLSNAQHLAFFPDDVECYEFLSAADCLVTDYSSVFFDFANTGKKIVLFTYDEEEYFRDRGVYFDIGELPFPNAKTTEQLIHLIEEPKTYDDTEFRVRFCTYDSPASAERIVSHVLGLKQDLAEQTITPDGGKKNVLLYCGGVNLKNGIITSLRSLLAHLDTQKYNVYFAFCQNNIKNGQPEWITNLRDDIRLYVIASPLQTTLAEHFGYKRYYTSGKGQKIWDRLMTREMRKHFPGNFFDTVVVFEGYGMHYMTPVLQRYPGKRIIFVHSNMQQEIQTRGNQKPHILREAYRSFDHVAIVSEDIRQATVELSGREDHVVVVNNTHNAQEVRERGWRPIELEKDTEIQGWNPGGIDGVLNSPGYKLISIGRFSPEKGHYRLMDAFDAFCDRYSDAQLIIIGSHGSIYGATKAYAKRKQHWRNITLIKSMSNPMPILRRCDLFILSSFYEGLGLVLLEADCLGVPSFSTACDGPTLFMQQHHGHLVENSTSGILQGMYDFVDGKVHTLEIDYDEYNRKAVQELEDIL